MDPSCPASTVQDGGYFLGKKMEDRQFCCAVCLDLLKDPVTIPCGHNYCMSCIETYWKAENFMFLCIFQILSWFIWQHLRGDNNGNMRD
uniref:RING-type domain-containing protein n=1 Tax=Maylandia zebra TaxID=106582 RepID=A0A3P9DGS7_9CICH